MNSHHPGNAHLEQLLQCAVVVMMAAIPAGATTDEGRLDVARVAGSRRRGGALGDDANRGSRHS